MSAIRGEAESADTHGGTDVHLWSSMLGPTDRSNIPPLTGRRIVEIVCSRNCREPIGILVDSPDGPWLSAFLFTALYAAPSIYFRMMHGEKVGHIPPVGFGVARRFAPPLPDRFPLVCERHGHHQIETASIQLAIERYRKKGKKQRIAARKVSPEHSVEE
jgi:hypothetical protein